MTGRYFAFPGAGSVDLSGLMIYPNLLSAFGPLCYGMIVFLKIVCAE